MHQDQAHYYLKRAEIETERAQQAVHPKAVAAHYQMATMYFERAEGYQEARG